MKYYLLNIDIFSHWTIKITIFFIILYIIYRICNDRYNDSVVNVNAKMRARRY